MFAYLYEHDIDICPGTGAFRRNAVTMGSISDSSTSTAINPMMERYVDDTGRRLLDALFEMGAPEGGERGFRPRKIQLTFARVVAEGGWLSNSVEAERRIGG